MKKFRKSVLSSIPFSLLLMISISHAKTNHYEAALQAYNQHDIKSTLIHLKNALQHSERNLPAKLLLAKVLIAKHSYEAADHELNDLIEQGVDNNLIISPLGESLLNQGQFDQALIFANNMTLKEEGLLAYSHIKARAYISLNNLEKAEIEYHSILTDYSNNLDALLGVATVYIYQKNNTKAKALLTKANTIVLTDNEILCQLKGHLARSNGQFNDAISYLTKANDLGPKNIETLRILIGCYVDIKNFTTADKVTDTVLKIVNNDPQTMFMKALILKR
jgi:tetratricopeptide (TPR) repeat protein